MFENYDLSFEEQLSRIEFRGSRHASLFLARFQCLSVGVAGREDLSSLMSSFPSDFDVSNFFFGGEKCSVTQCQCLWLTVIWPSVTVMFTLKTDNDIFLKLIQYLLINPIVMPNSLNWFKGKCKGEQVDGRILNRTLCIIYLKIIFFSFSVA